jgi:hypothetical protein
VRWCPPCLLLQLWDALNSKQQPAAFTLLLASSKEPLNSLTCTPRSPPEHQHTANSMLALAEDSGCRVQLLADALSSCRGDSGELQLSELGRSLRGDSMTSTASLTRLDSITALPADGTQPSCFAEQLADCIQPLRQQQDGTSGSVTACVSPRSSCLPDTTIAGASRTDAHKHASPVCIHKGLQDDDLPGSFDPSSSAVKRRFSTAAAAARAHRVSHDPVCHGMGLGWVWWDWRPHDLHFLAGFVQVRADAWCAVTKYMVWHMLCMQCSHCYSIWRGPSASPAWCIRSSLAV